jgi:hypothetical protein
LPKSLHRQATEFAERDGTSLNQFLVSAIAARVGAEEFYNRLTTQVFEKLKDHLSTTNNPTGDAAEKNPILAAASKSNASAQKPRKKAKSA